METLEPLLAEHPFLKGLDRRHLQVLTGCASNVRFETGTFVFRQGQEANTFYVLREGKIAIEIFSPQRGAITIDTVGAGEVLGWSWLIPPYHWHFDARALAPPPGRARAGPGQRRRSGTGCPGRHRFRSRGSSTAASDR
jgi:hypothetical protein